MIFTDREILYLSHIVARLAEPGLEDRPQVEQAESVLLYGNMIISIMGALPDNLTKEQLRSHPHYMLEAARIHLASELRRDLPSFSEDEIASAMDFEAVAGIAVALTPIAEVLIDVRPRVALMTELIDWNPESLDSELARLIGEG